jgi:hypothetical protein
MIKGLGSRLEDSAGPKTGQEDCDSVTLRAVVASWMRYARGCAIVTFERGPNYGDRPDVYGVNESRFGVEVEIKVSLSDFKRDLGKRKWDYQWIAPKFFYFMVPRSLVEKVRPILPEGAGLLTLAKHAVDPYSGLPALQCEVKPKANPKAKRLTLATTIKMVKNQTGTVCSLAVAQANFFRNANTKEKWDWRALLPVAPQAPAERSEAAPTPGNSTDSPTQNEHLPEVNSKEKVNFPAPADPFFKLPPASNYLNSVNSMNEGENT